MMNTTDIPVTKLIDRVLNNSTDKYCSEGFSTSRCYFIAFCRIFTYFLLALALFPQIIRLNIHRTQYIAGISYMWIVIRTLALISLLIIPPFKWSAISQLFALTLTIVIFIQILIHSNNLHRKDKIILIVVSLSIWIIGKILIFVFVKEKQVLLTIVYLLFAIQMLPQILLNSLLRTAKGLSKISIVLLALYDLLLFAILPTTRTSSIHLIAIYYSFSFFLFIYLQNFMYSDAHIHLISRLTHTILTPGVDIFTGLDINGTRGSGEDPQMFSVDDLESLDGSDIIYQAVTTKKPPERALAKKGFLWYATLGWIFCLETILTIILIYRIRSPWVLFVPLSIVLILSIFYLLRTRLNPLQLDILKKIL